MYAPKKTDCCDLPAEVVDVLYRFLPQPIAEAVLDQVATRCRGRSWTRPEDRRGLVASLSRAAGVFLRGSDVIHCREAFEAFVRSASEVTRRSRFHQVITDERDAGSARRLAMELARAWGASDHLASRAGAAVAELARNVLCYAARGEALGRCDGSALHVVVSDQGPGIPHIDDVLSGRFQSPTGMGFGLRGVKRIATTFAVHTIVGQGTTVSVSFKLAGARWAVR